MISNEQIETAAALLASGCREVSEVIAECEARGIDPDPVVLLVLRRGPAVSFEYPEFKREYRYANILTNRVWVGTPAMREALDLVRTAMPVPIRVQAIQ